MDKIVNSETVEKVKETMPNEELLYDIAELFKVFGDSTRIRIICALFDQEMCVYDLAACLDMTQSLISSFLFKLSSSFCVQLAQSSPLTLYLYFILFILHDMTISSFKNKFDVFII